MTTPEQHELRDELGRLLLKYRDLAADLRNLLEAERRALESPAGDELLSVATSKTQCVGEMQVLESRRLDICKRNGAATDDHGMHALFHAVGDCAGMDVTWREILEIARICRDLNNVNGAISRVRQEHMMTALATLSGHEHQPALYGPAGRAQAGYERRGIGQI